jgi:hypothetical protein
MPYEMSMDGAVLRIRLYDTLSAADLRRLASDVLDLEARVDPTPPRVTDFTGLTRFEVGFSEMLTFVERRRDSPPRQPIRSALLVDSDVQFGMARMFQTLNDHPLVTVEIFRDAATALAWVEAPAAKRVTTPARDEGDRLALHDRATQ